MTARFVTVLEDLIASRPDEVRQLGAVYLIELRGEGEDKGGQPDRTAWTLDATSDPPRLFAGRPEVHDCGLSASPADLARVLDDPLLANALSLEGRLAVSGNTAVAARFAALIHRFHRT